MTDQTTASGPTCSKCGNAPAGPGGILCTECVQKIQRVRLSDPTS